MLPNVSHGDKTAGHTKLNVNQYLTKGGLACSVFKGKHLFRNKSAPCYAHGVQQHGSEHKLVCHTDSGSYLISETCCDLCVPP